MTKKARNTVTYNLRDRNKVVYKGTTNDTDRREQEHKDEGKQFTRFEITSRCMTKESAMEKEKKSLEQYRGNHQGDNPKYNDDDSG